jgi:site-specific recombinase XerC
LQVKGREDKERPVLLMPETVAVLETYLAKRSAVEDDALFIASVVQGVQSPAGSAANRM